MRNKLQLTICIIVLAGCSTPIAQKNAESMNASSIVVASSSVNAAPIQEALLKNPSTRVVCKPANKKWEEILKKEVQDSRSVQLDNECDLPDHGTALTALVFKNGENYDYEGGLFIFDRNDALVHKEAQGFTVFGGDIGTCELLMYESGYLFVRCNSSEGGGVGVNYSAYRIADGKKATIAGISGGLDREGWGDIGDDLPSIPSDVSIALDKALNDKKSMYPYSSPYGNCHIPDPNDEDNAVGDAIAKVMTGRVFRSILLTCTIGDKQFSIYSGPLKKGSYDPTDIGYAVYDSSRLYGSGSFYTIESGTQGGYPQKIVIHIDEKYIALNMKISGSQSVETAEYQISLSSYKGGRLYSESTYKNKDLCEFMNFPCDQVLSMK